eukprot:m51a1_g10597 hypothetical protein (245) ;mRNA; r:31754-32488
MDLGFEQGSASWIESRFSHVTATDLGKILGVDTTCSRTKLLLSKINHTDLLKKAPPVTKKLVQNGKLFEESACAAYTAWRFHNGFTDAGFTPMMYSHKQFPFITGSPDHLFPDTCIVAEFKTHFYPSFDRSQPIESVQRIPLRYYLQVQTYLNIMEWDIGHLFSWTPMNGHSLFHISRDPQLWETLLVPSARWFYELMKDDSIPLGEKSKMARMTANEKRDNINDIWESLNSHSAQLDVSAICL